jgi:hypothetical protein
MITSEDLRWLKCATPAELMTLTNGIPWQLCAWIKVELTQTRESLAVEQQKWMAAGTVPLDPGEIERWLKARSNLLNPCPECGSTRHPQPKPGRRVSFSKQQGFGLHYLCVPCLADWDNHFDVHALLKAAKGLQERWKGRCFARVEVAQ